MKKLLIYAKVSAIVLVFLMIANIVKSVDLDLPNWIPVTAGYLLDAILLGFFIFIIAISKSGSKLIKPSAIGILAVLVAVLTTVIQSHIIKKYGVNTFSDNIVYFQVGYVVYYLLILLAFFLLSRFFTKNKRLRVAAIVAGAIPLVVYMISWPIYDAIDMTKYYSIVNATSIFLNYGSLIWFFLEFSNQNKS